MRQTEDIDKTLEALARQNAQLGGLAIATGAILTHLLQTMCLREMNPQFAATKIITNATKAIDDLKPGDDAGDAAQKALEAVKLYEAQIRAVLPT